MEVVITGIGLVSALGRLKASWNRIIAGESGIDLHQPFAEMPPRPLGLMARTPADLSELIHQVVADALQDADLVAPLLDCGVAIGSSRSYQAQWERLARGEGRREKGEGRREQGSKRSGEQKIRGAKDQGSKRSGEHFSFLTSSVSWLETLPHMAAIATARQIGATGPVLAPMAACATGVWAIAQGFELIKTGQCQRAIAGALEAPITPLTLAGFAQMGALAKTGAYPFDQHREGLVLGEGGALFVLESAELARQRSARIYGKILSFGLTNDACYANSPELNGSSAIAAVKKCCDRANLSPTEIDYIHAHGTATQLNDQFEANLIQQVFPKGVPVSSTKGATGHTLGASGALGVAFCLMALQHQIIPPCVGLRESEFDIDLVTEARQCNLKNLLCLSFGFGGQNTAIALGR